MSEERRRDARAVLTIPLRVQGFLMGGGSWEEISTTLDVCAGGLSFSLKHPVELGHVLYLSLPLPKRLRRHDLNDASYRVYSLVRFVKRRANDTRIGVMFFGRFPPRGFKDQPGGHYLLPGDPRPRATKQPTPGAAVDPPSSQPPSAAATAAPPAADPPGAAPAVPPAPSPGVSPVEFLPSAPPERRASPRTEMFVNFTLRQVDAAGAVIQEELTVADNICPGGVRVMTSLDFKVGDVVLLQEAGGSFATRAEVRGVTSVQPSIGRLHLRFVDQEAPPRLLR